ncbi:N-acetylmuramoyl-L-alanine amidase [Sphingobacteriales bacterium UPWRP_1]|nr:hypothetical protein BVG80_04985 [Sphingobacteriales bacterium TSM_CSM]PSJ73761.1 N-acetylmuramoyl-L-alanine amidase [Sphingobacteriales bacterium UPWRP_1]
MKTGYLNAFEFCFIKKIAVYFFVFSVLWLVPSLSKESPYYYRTIQTVVIDAGHGGKDNGCSGKTTKEKDVALSVALKLGKYITENVPGVKVLYTRKDDTFVELHERASFANRNGGDLFISIHCNSAPETATVHGTETYIMGAEKAGENLEVAFRENSVIALEKNYKDNYDGFNLEDPQSTIIFTLFQSSHIKESEKLARKIDYQFKNRANRNSRGVKPANFLVLYKTNMPSVLIETGFLTNKSEEKYLASDDGQAYIASAIYRAFKEYKADWDDRAKNGEKKTQK